MVIGVPSITAGGSRVERTLELLGVPVDHSNAKVGLDGK
jgi:hypothetical protein